MPGDVVTCGQGLAANAALPEKLGALLASMADLLENHARSLDAADPTAKQERDAYARLVKEQRSIALSLQALAVAMTGYRDLPAAPHDVGVLVDEPSLDVFSAFIRAEEGVADLLQKTAAEHHGMLTAMQGE